jgi:hypothetical protein
MKFRHWKLIVAFLVVFVAGGVAGSAGTAVFIHHAITRALNPKIWSANVLGDLQGKLHLTPAQHARIEAALNDAGPEFKAAYERTVADFGHTIVALQARIDAELDPEQRRIHDELKAEFRRRLKAEFNATLPEK